MLFTAKFLLASLIAIFTGMSYAEFTSESQMISAEYSFVRGFLSDRLAFITGMVDYINVNNFRQCCFKDFQVTFKNYLIQF